MNRIQLLWEEDPTSSKDRHEDQYELWFEEHFCRINRVFTGTYVECLNKARQYLKISLTKCLEIRRFPDGETIQKIYK